jgi:hypothetical protein
MRAKAKLLLFLGIALLIGTLVSAADPLVLYKISTSNEYPVANGVDQTIIRVAVTNVSNTPPGYLPGATVIFTVDPTMGSMSPTVAITDAFGYANSTFTTKTRSGTAHINATAQYDVFTNAIPTNIDQKIDHDSPYIYIPHYPDEGVVGTVVPFSATYTDRWGNPIDNVIKPENHPVQLSVYGPAPDDCGFAEAAFGHIVTQNLDSAGNLSVNVRMTSTAGPNNIHIYPFGSITHTWGWISAVTKGVPFSIAAEYYPPGPPPSQIVNNNINIKYTLIDKFGNPAGDQQISVTSDGLGGPWLYTTNSEGNAFATYSQPFAGDYIINGTPISNTSIRTSGLVHFYNANATLFTISANPQMMPSLDANPSISSTITVKVMDIMGNPVKNEIVTFSPPHDIQLNAANETSSAYILTTNAVTDVNGEATTIFIPGAFVNSTQPNYKAAATGTCLVTATWNGNNQNVQLTWKNYPYLSAVVAVSKPIVFVNDTFDVSIKLNGDGWALASKPIDVVICTDVSGSMASKDPATALKTKMAYAIEGGQVFSSQLKSQDRVALDSFGRYSYSTGQTWDTIDLPLTYDKTTVNAMLGTYTGVGNTPTRAALHNATLVLKNGARTDAIKAIILLSDGDWNVEGDPRGISTSWPIRAWPADSLTSSSSVVTWAKDNGIKIYTIGLGQHANAADLTAYATETGGKYYPAPDGAQLAAIYTQIAGELKTEAGVDTQATMDFTTLTVNNASMAGVGVLEYVPDPPTLPSAAPGSTWIHKFNKTHVSRNEIINQKADWDATQQLVFNDIGTIHINETWETSFRFKMLKPGNIDLLDHKSSIKFNDSQNTGVNQLFLPNISVIGQPNWSGIWSTQSITLSNLKSTATGEITDVLPVSWETVYTGNATVTEQLYYSIDNGPWVKFDEKSGIVKGDTISTADLSITSLPPGGYRIKVYATADDAPDATITMTTPIAIGGKGRYFIKLE